MAIQNSQTFDDTWVESPATANTGAETMLRVILPTGQQLKRGVPFAATVRAKPAGGPSPATNVRRSTPTQKTGNHKTFGGVNTCPIQRKSVNTFPIAPILP